MAHLARTAPRSDGITVARVIAPDHRVSTTSDTDADGRAQRLPEDLLRLSHSVNGPVVLDCRGVDMIDSSGVGIILSLWKGLRLANHDMVICATESFRQVFEVARLTRLIPCVGDMPGALRAIHPDAGNDSDTGPMTPELWWTDPDPYHRLECLPTTIPTRKLRLFAVACGRRLSHLLGNAACRRAMDIAEAHADGGATDDELCAAHVLATSAVADADTRGRLTAAIGAAGATANPNPLQAAWTAAAWTGEIDGPESHHPIIDDVFGNPFHPPTLDPGWLAPAVRDLAWQIDHDVDFDLLPRLVESLTAAGCDQPELLAHCTVPNGHVRGCWAIDLLLGK